MPQFSEEELSHIIGEIYDCALNPDGWSATLAKVSDAVDAAYCSISLADSRGGGPRMAAHSPWDPEQLRILNERFGRDGIPGARAIVLAEEDRPWISSHHFGEDELAATPFFREWVHPQGLRDACMLKFAHTADRMGVLGTVTRATRDLIKAEEARFLALLSPHFRRAALIGDLLDNQRVEMRLYREALDRLATAVILASASGRITYANARAEAILAAGDFMSQSRGRLKLAETAAGAALAQALAHTADGGRKLGHQGIGIPLHGSRGRAVAYVLPLSGGRERPCLEMATAAVFIATDSLPDGKTTESLLAAMFGVTPMEARVMQAVGSGLSPLDCAARLGVSENTVKSHLSRVFEKTGTARQVELVGLYRKLTPPFDT